MTWTKLADDLPDRLLELSDAAFRLHVAATVYSNRVSSDGRIVKTRLSLVPVPPKTRRKTVTDELIRAGLWQDSGDAWQLVGFFMDQMSAEEVRLTREYNRVREAKRLANQAQNKASFELEERAVLVELQAARERRKTQSRSAFGSAIGNAPLRPVPSRSVPNESEDGRQGLSPTPLGGATTALNGHAKCPGCGHPLASDPDGCAHPEHANAYEQAAR